MLRVAFSLALMVMATSCSEADFPSLTNSEPESEQDWLSAEDAAAQMKVPPGFSVSVFASEPDVQNPIAMTWDSQGRLWVAENYTYAERKQRFDLTLRDRVVVFDNTGGDRFQTRTVFNDNLQMLTGIEVGHGGVWLMCPPQLLFIPDADGDAQADGEAQVVLDGFEVAKQNYHNFANGLRFGPDGWLYGRCGGSCPGRIGVPGTPEENRRALEGGIWRFHPMTKAVEVLTSGTTNPWGHDWNSVGELFFVNTVNGHLWHAFPGAHFVRPFTLDPQRRTYELIDFHADHWHFDTSGSWTASRGGTANEFGGGHAHSGTMIYEEHTWPKQYRDRLFTLNLHGLRANQELLRRRGSGYVAQHAEDFFVAADPWFRGMELSAGPDGNVFVFDWSDTGECHEHTGVHRTSGRIFKISYDGKPSGEQPVLGKWTNDAICDAIVSGSKWHRQQARLVLASRSSSSDLSCVPALRERLTKTTDSTQKLNLYLALFDLKQLKDQELFVLLEPDVNEHLRAWAIRMLVDSMPTDDAMGAEWKPESVLAASRGRSEQIVERLLDTVGTGSQLVHLAVASCLGRFPLQDRLRLAGRLVQRGADADDHNLPLLIWYGLIPCAEDGVGLARVAGEARLPTTLRLISRCLAEEIERQPQALDALLRRGAEREAEYQLAILKGLSEGFAGWPSAPKPKSWETFVANTTEQHQTLVRELSVVFGDGRAMGDLIQVAAGKTKSTHEIQLAALQRLIEINPPELRDVCESLLDNNRMNVLAARGLSRFDDPQIAKLIVQRYNRFRGPFKPQVISILSSRASFSRQMLEGIREGKIPRDDLTAFQVRQILAGGDSELRELVREVWGEVRDSPQEKQQQIERWKAALDPATLAASDKSHGRALFKKNCQNCHRLYGEGGTVGPDLTGANRSNLDYLLGNIIDPSSVVDKDFRMSVIILDDSRVISGLVTDRSEKTTKIQTATEALVISNDSIELSKVTEKSPMPEGMLDTLSDKDVKDLLGYLSYPSQVPLDPK